MGGAASAQHEEMIERTRQRVAEAAEAVEQCRVDVSMRIEGLTAFYVDRRDVLSLECDVFRPDATADVVTLPPFL